MDQHVRDALTRSIEILDREISWRQEDIDNSEAHIFHLQSAVRDLTEKRVALAKHLGVVF